MAKNLPVVLVRGTFFPAGQQAIAKLGNNTPSIGVRLVKMFLVQEQSNIVLECCTVW